MPIYQPTLRLVTASVTLPLEELAWLGDMFRQCSLPALLDAVSVADDELLRHAQRQWCAVLARLRVLVSILMSEVAASLDSYGRNGAAKFGAWFIVLYIQGQRLGYGDRIDDALARGLAWLDGTGIPWVRSYRSQSAATPVIGE